MSAKAHQSQRTDHYEGGEMVSDKSEESLSVIIAKLLTLIEGKAGAFRSSPEQASRQLSAAGLMRCCAIVRAIGHLEDVNLGALAPGLVRLHWETWLVSIYVLLGGEVAMDDLQADDVYWKRLLNEKLGLQLPYPRSEWQGTPRKLNFWELSEKIKPLLLKAGEASVPKGTIGYDVMYRVQSTFGAHANLHSLLLHLVLDQEKWPIKTNPVCPFTPAAHTPAMNTAHLAGYVFKEFEIPLENLDTLSAALLDFNVQGSAPNQEGG